VVIATLIPTVLLVFPVDGLVLRELGLTARRFITEAVLPSVPAIVVQCAVGLPLLIVASHTHSLLVVLALASLSALAGVAAYVVLGLDARRRQVLLVTVRQTVGLETEATPESSKRAPDADATPDGAVQRPRS